MYHRTITVVIASVLLVTAFGMAAAGASPGIGKYHDVDRAIEDGYVPFHGCIPNMGFHYVNFGLVDDEVDVSQPEALVYAENDAGELVLLGAEYFSTAEFELFGHHAHLVPGVGLYAVHGWFFVHNENGFTAELHSRVDASCNLIG